jgi:hypothetical protein
VKYLLSRTDVFCRLVPLSHVKSANANGTFALSARADGALLPCAAVEVETAQTNRPATTAGRSR